MVHAINFGTEFTITEIVDGDLDHVFYWVKNQSIPYQFYFVYDSKNHKLYGFDHAKRQLNHEGRNYAYLASGQTYTFNYGENLDKYFSITVTNHIFTVKVWTKENMKPKCIYNSDWGLFSGNISEAAV